MHAQHGTAPAAALDFAAPRSNAEISATRPATTLRPDRFDAAAPISVREARRAAYPIHDDGLTGTTAPDAGHDAHKGHGQEKATLYVCPMHPEVTSATPASCPKCGMALVKKE